MWINQVPLVDIAPLQLRDRPAQRRSVTRVPEQVLRLLHRLGGFAVVEVPTREAALHWAGRIAAACRAPQQVFELLPPPSEPEVEKG